MAQVSASSSHVIPQTPEKVLDALLDYETLRPRILSEEYLDYRVVEGGRGAGTRVQWTLQATKKRSRNIDATVTVEENTIVERDGNSSLVTTWTVAPSGSGSEVTTTTEWKGAGGIGGFFEKTFAPLGLKKIQAKILANLEREIR